MLSDTLKEFPGNEAVYQRLLELTKSKQAMAFAGAGVSTPLYPLWGGLIEFLIQEALKWGAATEADAAFWRKNAGKKPLQMAGQILGRLGKSRYETFLYETFKPKPERFTPAHAALAGVNFKAIITTNYDPGILEARHDAGLRDSGYTVWNQETPVRLWLNRDLFAENPACPLLYAHGHYSNPGDIVLDRDSYRAAYQRTPYRRLFEDLWYREHLVFAGFSLEDPVLEQVADEVLEQVGAGAPRHVAILGLEEEDYSPEMRIEYLERFNAEVIFYRVRQGDHSSVVELLNSLPRAAAVTAPISKPKPAARATERRFVHETTDDERFTGRDDLLARLDGWVREESVRVVAISAVGGLGKTALVGHWLKRQQEGLWDGILFWSFYRDRDPGKFLKELQPARLSSQRMLVALDGLEVLQEMPGTVAYGELLSPEVADLLHAHCNGNSQSLLVLTSRFPFPDLNPYIGGALRSLPLAGLPKGEGAALLKEMGLGGEEEDRKRISEQLEGHPLALRIFARSVPPKDRGDPTRIRQFEIGHGELEDKMKRLLGFYEKTLPEEQRLALGLVSLFRMPVSAATLSRLWESLLRRNQAALSAALGTLHGDHLLTGDTGSDGQTQYACHPILRDHFRRGALGDQAKEAASLIAGQPDEASSRSPETIRRISAAIEVLLDAGEVEAADDLYTSRLGNGYVFISLPAPHWGMEVALNFVRDADRRSSLASRISTRGLGFYLNEVGLFANHAGEPETALVWYRESVALYRREEDERNLSIGLQNLGDTESRLGLLPKACGSFQEALELARKVKGEREECNSLAYLGYATSLRGEVAEAESHFRAANAIENRIDPDGDDLYSLHGVQWAEHLMRIGASEEAARLTEANRKICEENQWQNDVARCDWMLGWVENARGRPEPALEHLGRAKETFTTGHMIHELARALVREAECHLMLKNRPAAFAACERALQLARPRNYRVVMTDALNLRAGYRLEAESNARAARDDAEAALQLAEFCEYAWGRRDAHALLARAYDALGKQDEATVQRRKAEQLIRGLEVKKATKA
ncbi:MAG: hypothetical protein FJW20_22580 [Acidimicrobiia bacterium]|nr:hypothetical protein [Acidimicrobiia bacterium]